MLGALRNFLKRGAQIPVDNWDIPLPEKLWFAKSSDDAFMPPELTSLQEIQKILGIKWLETSVVEQRKKKSLISEIKKISGDFISVSSSDYLARLDEIQNKCVIRKLNNPVGWVVTLLPGETLTAGFLTCYTGLLAAHDYRQSLTYQDREYFFSLKKTDKADIGIDGKIQGNVGRLFPFLLEKTFLDNFALDESIRDAIAVANLTFRLVKREGIVMPGIFVPDTITAPSDREVLLGLNYSLEYLCKMLQSENGFSLINRNTLQIIDPHLYPPKMLEIHLEGLSYSFSISRFRAIVAGHFPSLEFKTYGCDEAKQDYFEIAVSHADLCAAILREPDNSVITVKPGITRISSAEWQSRQSGKTKLPG